MPPNSADDAKCRRRPWLPYALLATALLIALLVVGVVLLTVFGAGRDIAQSGARNASGIDDGDRDNVSPTMKSSTRHSTSTTNEETSAPDIETSTYTAIRRGGQSENIPICSATTKRVKCKAIRHAAKDDEMVPSEKDVTVAGHFSGFRPRHYAVNLTINRDQATSFFGSVKILLTAAIDGANRILIHADSAISNLDLAEIVVRTCESGEELCVGSLVRQMDQQLIIIDLLEPVVRGTNLEVSIASFSGANSPGLHSQNTDPPAWSQRRSWVVSTIFQMRHARTVFPCLDHPTLKAAITLCIRHPPRSQARANMPSYFSELDEEDQRWRRTCFSQSPTMSSYLYAFAVFDRMQSITRAEKSEQVTEESPEIEVILADQLDKTQFEWVRDETKQALTAMTTVTGFAYPLSHLALLTSSLPVYGIENFGLITLNEQWIEYPRYDLAHTILAHEVTHQWIGNLFTIGSWHDICLQEGLNTYMEWMIGSQFSTVTTPVSQRIREKRNEAMKDEIANNTLIRAFDTIAEPPVIFAMLEEAFGPGTITRFLRIMVNHYAFANAGLAEWVKAMSVAANNDFAGSILRQYFTRPGFPLLHIRRSSTGLQVSQMVMEKNAILAANAQPFTVPLTILDSNNANVKFILNENRQTLAYPTTANWLIADLNATSYARIVYEPENYIGLFNCEASSGSRCPVQINQLQNVAGDLCFALMSDQLDPSPTTLGHWVTVFENIVERRLATGDCACCVNWKAGRTAPGACKWTWNDRCEKIRLLQTLVTLHSKKVHRVRK